MTDKATRLRSTRFRYKAPGRLADVLALIQVLALDEGHTHRSADDLQRQLGRGPIDAGLTWLDIAMAHPEFFRCATVDSSTCTVPPADGLGPIRDGPDGQPLKFLPQDALTIKEATELERWVDFHWPISLICRHQGKREPAKNGKEGRIPGLDVQRSTELLNLAVKLDEQEEKHKSRYWQLGLTVLNAVVSLCVGFGVFYLGATLKANNEMRKADPARSIPSQPKP